CQQGDSNPFSF
nr:immunoglobulin light chain junction region [Macaca mulatta]